MSDEMAKKREEEEQQIDEETRKKLEEQEKRLWKLQLIFDPETGAFAMQPANGNVTKTHHIDTMLLKAIESRFISVISKSVAAFLAQMLQPQAPQKPKKKGLFRR